MANTIYSVGLILVTTCTDILLTVHHSGYEVKHIFKLMSRLWTKRPWWFGPHIFSSHLLLQLLHQSSTKPHPKTSLWLFESQLAHNCWASTDLNKTHRTAVATLGALVTTAAEICESKRRRSFIRIHNFLSLVSFPPVAATRRLAMVGAGLALPGHLLQEAGQAGTAALPMLVAAQGLHTAEGLRLGGW